MRAIALSLVLAAALGAQVTSRYNAQIAALASALAEHNAEDFLSYFDLRAPALASLKADVRALTDQADIHSGIDEIADDGDQVVVDWIMSLSSRTDPSQTERRRATVRLTFDRTGKKPRIVSVDPPDYFRPPHFGR